MTPDEIDKLDGLELRLAVARAVEPLEEWGKKKVDEWNGPCPHYYESDLDAAFDAVRAAGKRLDRRMFAFADQGSAGVVEVDRHDTEPIEIFVEKLSPNTNAAIATAICRAMLKAANQMEKP